MTPRETVKHRQERRNRIYTRLSGVTSAIIGGVKEMYHSNSGNPEALWGTVFGINATTSLILIGFGVLLIAFSFPKFFNGFKNIFKRK